MKLNESGATEYAHNCTWIESFYASDWRFEFDTAMVTITIELLLSFKYQLIERM